MAWSSGGNKNTERYSPKHVRAMLDASGVSISSETSKDFLCFCPFHSNVNTPSMSVSRTKGTYICFNADCAATGNLISLLAKLTDRTYFEAVRYVLMNKPTKQQEFEAELHDILAPKADWKEFPPDVLVTLRNQMLEPGNAGREYMRGRGFTDDTIDHFELGYSSKRNMVAVPVHSPDGVPLGLVGRTIEGKGFHNSAHMPTSRTLFNLHRAKRASPTAIISEASFDVMAVYQAGYPNGVGTLGGYLSDERLSLLGKYFDTYIIFTDNREIDAGGKALGNKVVERFGGSKQILWALYDYKNTYPNDYKDATEIQEKINSNAVAQCIENAIPHFEYAESVL